MSNDISKAIDAIANASGGALGKAIKEAAPPRSASARLVRAATYESPKTIPQRSSNYTVAKFPVKSWEERLKEAAKLGFSVAVVPKANAPRKPIEGLTIHAVDRIEEAIALLRTL